MAKTKTTKRASRAAGSELDSVYLLKLLLYVLLGSIWIKLGHGDHLNLPIPAGLFIGLIFTGHEHFRIDRKIEYAVLLVAMLVGYFAPYGLYLNF